MYVTRQFEAKILEGHKVRRTTEKSRPATAMEQPPHLRHSARHSYTSSGWTRWLVALLHSKNGTTKVRGQVIFPGPPARAKAEPGSTLRPMRHQYSGPSHSILLPLRGNREMNRICSPEHQP